VSLRNSGQGEWGYDVFRTKPLQRLAGVEEEKGYLLEIPVFSEDEIFIIGAAGTGFLGHWWSHPDDDPETPARGGPVSLGHIFIHHLPGHPVSRHELSIDLPAGWIPSDIESDEWYGIWDLKPIVQGIQFTTAWGVEMEIPLSPPPIIQLAVPHPDGTGTL
jgi:hypothetical protein